MKSRSSTPKEVAQTAIDDPCWGDPDHCSLKYLLSLLPRSRAILHESNNYIVLNKPADLRMDGPYPSTVHKLLTYWFPPLSLQSLSQEDLLKNLAKLHSHADHPDNELRACHQLDYATSGVLLFARSVQSACWASSCFEGRRVAKVYTAILHGHIPIEESTAASDATTASNSQKDGFTTKNTYGMQPIAALPEISLQKVNSFLKQQETEYRKARQKKQAKTFMGYQPPGIFLDILQSRLRLFFSNNEKIRKRKRNERITNDQWANIFDAMQLPKEDQTRLATSQLKWKQIKENEPALQQAVERAANCYNNFMRIILERENRKKSDSESLQDLPTIFRVEGDDPNAFYIYLPLAQASGEFAMRIPDGYKDRKLPTGDVNMLNFKVSLTRCLVLQHATLKGHPVTKVQLIPETGRRHQLRVHTAFVGFPIVGDQTYPEYPPEANDDRDAQLSPRMCLHAFKLELELPKQLGESNSDSNLSSKESLRAIAPDPFPISETDEVKEVAHM